MNDVLSTGVRIYSGLLVAGIGDALGAPTEQWSMEEIEVVFGRSLVSRFIAPPIDTFAGANNGKIAEITDDASQMYYLSTALILAKGNLTNENWIACLLSWRDTSPKSGFMGPSTEALITALKEGKDHSRFGVIGTSNRKMTDVGATNGAAMRAAPIGMCFPGDIERTANITLNTCLPSHDTSVAIEAACAISCGTSVAMISDDVEQVIDGCRQGALLGRALAKKYARQEAGPRFLARLELALRIANEEIEDFSFLSRLEAEVGNSVLAAESVPAAIGIFAYAKGDPWKAIRLSATIGNDSDSIAAMTGAISGVLSGHQKIPNNLIEQFVAANPEFDLHKLSGDLASIADANTKFS